MSRTSPRPEPRTRPHGRGSGSGNRSWQRPLLPGQGPLTRVHPAIAFLGVLVVFAVGVWWSGLPGMLLLGLLAVTVGVLLAAAWPRLTAAERAVRLLILATLVTIALQQWP